MHAGPAVDSHFKLVLISEGFANMSKVKRHQAVYKVLALELAGSVHALAMHLHTPSEWAQLNGAAHDSPECSNKQ